MITFICEVRKELGKGNMHHCKGMKASYEGISSPNLEALTQEPLVILITSVKLGCVDQN